MNRLIILNVLLFLILGKSVEASLLGRNFIFSDCFVTEDKCPNSNISFWLYSRETENNPTNLNIENLSPDAFTPKRPLIVLIHGYTGHKDFSPNIEIRPPLLSKEDVYVISLDYNGLVREPCYIQAARNVQVVGRCTAKFLDLLIQKNLLALEDIHVIGFSLGAQVAGVIGHNMKSGKLKRITGLDPAKPLFILAGAEKKLDKSDAEFVDVIHTDILKRGMLQTLGHVDFYPNGGVEQPGCAAQTVTSTGSCNHKRAPEYYGESIVTNVGFYGFSCKNWLNFALGICKWTDSVQVELMGYYVSTSSSGVYVLQTNAEPPFARGPYPEAASNILTLDNGETIDEGILFNTVSE